MGAPCWCPLAPGKSAAPTRAAVQLVHMPTKLQSCSALLSAGDTSESIPWARASALSMNTSIFCWAVVAASTYESALAMHTLRSCDDWLILSNASRLANGVHATQLFEGSLEVPRSRSYRTVLNTPIFIKAWRHLLREETIWRQHQWVVKLGVDTVLLVPVLRGLLAKLDPAYPLALAGSRDGFRADEYTTPLLGAIIPLSTGAYRPLQSGLEECARHLPHDDRGEDHWFALCVERSGIISLHVPGLIRHGPFMASIAPCSSTVSSAAYHGPALKITNAHQKCTRRARRSLRCADSMPGCDQPEAAPMCARARAWQAVAGGSLCTPNNDVALRWLKGCGATCGLCSPLPPLSMESRDRARLPPRVASSTSEGFCLIACATPTADWLEQNSSKLYLQYGFGGISRYAAKHDDVFFHPIFHSRPHEHCNVERVRTTLKLFTIASCQWVVWLEGDTFITTPTVHPRHFVQAAETQQHASGQPPPELIFSYDITGTLNTGVGLIRRSQLAAALMEEVLMQVRNRSHPLIRAFDHQGALMLMHKQPQVRQYISLLDPSLLNPSPAPHCTSCRLHDASAPCHNIHLNFDPSAPAGGKVPCRNCTGYWQPGAWLIHFAGPNKRCLPIWLERHWRRGVRDLRVPRARKYTVKPRLPKWPKLPKLPKLQ